MISTGDSSEIINKGRKLFRHKMNSDIDLKPESNTKFFYTNDNDWQIAFTIDNSGKVIDAFFINGGFKEIIKKLPR